MEALTNVQEWGEQLKCVYCSKIFKENSEGQKGNASICLRVPPDVRLMMQQSLNGVVVKKKKKEKIAKEITNLNPVNNEIEVFGNDQIELNNGIELFEVSNLIESSWSFLVGQCRECSGELEVGVPLYHDIGGSILKNSVEEVKTDFDKQRAT
ncbi:hypothetical protein GH714_011065 [Hevea brasiliensis]|uniref:Uncharacterized protein n=1 Tax=Hevea brasiliensis TaxID=3981 RepID=A0A6A6N0F8_HEVBR|nr:hypothetical protein GH714_011065 [Hevea brasiliensis]